MQCKILPLSYFVSISILLSACSSYNYINNAKYSPIASEPCYQKWEGVYTFYEGEALDFTYYKLGIVEVNNYSTSNTNVLLNTLKTEAWYNCANAIINIKRTSSDRITGVNDFDFGKQYQSNDVLRAMAVKINIDANFIAKYGYLRDTSFVREDYYRYQYEARIQQEIQQDINARRTRNTLIVLDVLNTTIQAANAYKTNCD